MRKKLVDQFLCKIVESNYKLNFIQLKHGKFNSDFHVAQYYKDSLYYRIDPYGDDPYGYEEREDEYVSPDLINWYKLNSKSIKRLKCRSIRYSVEGVSSYTSDSIYDEFYRKYLNPLIDNKFFMYKVYYNKNYNLLYIATTLKGGFTDLYLVKFSEG